MIPARVHSCSSRDVRGEVRSCTGLELHGGKVRFVSSTAILKLV